MSQFSQEILKWHTKNKRNLPWKNTRNVYKIWISEIMLQQTRVEQMKFYYKKFLKTFPTLESLAKARENEVLKLWEGLGYYTRARNLHQSAKYIYEKLNGVFPCKYEDILKLKGVGEYTAAAIASFAFQLPYAVLDGNVCRVIARYFGIKHNINSAIGKKIFISKAQKLLDKNNPAGYNQAIMDFGAKFCTPRKPKCENCPLQQTCIAFKTNTVKELPNIERNLNLKKRYFYYFLIQNANELYISKRTKEDIWKNLYELPLIEKNRHTSIKNLYRSKDFKIMFSKIDFKIKDIQKLTHKLTHQELHVTFFCVISSDILPHNGYIKINANNIAKYPFPIPIKNYLFKMYHTKQS